MLKPTDSLGLMPCRLWVAAVLLQGIVPPRTGGYTPTDRRRMAAEALALADELMAQANGAARETTATPSRIKEDDR